MDAVCVCVCLLGGKMVFFLQSGLHSGIHGLCSVLGLVGGVRE